MMPSSLRPISIARTAATFLFAFAACSAAHAEPHALLPAVTKLAYQQGALPLCRVHLPVGASADPIALSVLRDKWKALCGKGIAASSISLTVEQTQRGDSLPGVDDQADTHGRESYTIHIDKAGIQLRAKTSAGIFYAVQTLLQMVDASIDTASLPYVDIEDEPALPYRGFMMDTAHGAVPTIAEIERQLDLIATWKGNQYFFYVETNIDLQGYPLLHAPGNYSAADIATVVAYARARHIDVVPCVELYGHLHDLFRIERYSDLSALPHGGEANPAEAQLQGMFTDWVKQYAAMFPSKWFHLGFDEPFELERAGSKRAGGVSPDVLWLRHLKAMADVATSLGKRPLFWADIDEGAYIFNKYPGLAASLPKGAIAAPWFYDARDNYSDLIKLFRENHVPLLVASGISDWDNIAPDFRSTFINIDGMLAAGREANTIGLLNTMWSDSALPLHRNADAAVAYGAAAAWQAKVINRSAFFADYARITYGQHAEDFAAALQSLTVAQTELQAALGSETSFRMWDDPFTSKTLARVRANTEHLKQARLAAEQAQEHLLHAKASAAAVPDDYDSLWIAARMIDYAGMKFLYAAEIAENFDALPQHPQAADLQYLLKREGVARNHSRAGDLIDQSGELSQEYAAEWNREYKPYRLSTATARWSAEQQYWIAFQQRVWTITRNFRAGDPRPILNDALAAH